MTAVEATYDDFISSRRSGRRNAIHDIPGAPGGETPADLSQRNVNKSGEDGGNAEKSQGSPATAEEIQTEGT